jgi:hypothetical protein
MLELLPPAIASANLYACDSDKVVRFATWQSLLVLAQEM